MKQRFSNRKYTFFSIFIILGIVFAIRLLYLQVIDDSYPTLANRNALRNITIYPERGLILDRKGNYLVYNDFVYDVMIIPRKVKGIDTAEFCKLIGISIDDFKIKLAKANTYSPHKASILEKQISKETNGLLQGKLYKFNGAFYTQRRSLRKYPRSIAAHVLGYIGEVNEDMIKKNPYYQRGDYIGMSGLEKYYEEYLRGKKGSKIVMVDVHNREKGSFQNGEFDTTAIAGEILHSSIDADLQEYGEKLMVGKIGSIVAIEPSSGEILAIISSPSYDPGLLVGRERGNNYAKLLKEPNKPLFDRALMAEYPPGSIFKIVQALIALEEGVIDVNTGFPCDKSLVGCHNHAPANNVINALKVSCNPYFYRVFQRILYQNKSSNRFIDTRLGYIDWRENALSFGIGQKLELDLPNQRRGLLPKPEFYDKWYGKNRWNFYTIQSLSIGQGEMGIIPIQMANLAAIFANRGYYYTPHLIRKIGENTSIDSTFTTKHKPSVRDEYFNIVVQAMYDAVYEPGGTARLARIDDIQVCGKTGTAQNPHGKDHSVFIAFAPKDNPKIAISVYIENAGFGGTWAAPIASLMIEKYIKGEISRKDLENNMMQTKLY